MKRINVKEIGLLLCEGEHICCCVLALFILGFWSKKIGLEIKLFDHAFFGGGVFYFPFFLIQNALRNEQSLDFLHTFLSRKKYEPAWLEGLKWLSDFGITGKMKSE